MLKNEQLNKYIIILSIFSLCFFLATIGLIFGLTTEINNVIRVKHLIVFAFSILFTLTANNFLFAAIILISYRILRKKGENQ